MVSSLDRIYLTIRIWFFFLKKSISHFKGGKKILFGQSSLQWAIKWKIWPYIAALFWFGLHSCYCVVWTNITGKKCLFFSQNILNCRNVKIFSRTFLPLPQDSSWDKITFYKHQVEILIMAPICSVLPPEANIWRYNASCWPNTLEGFYGIISVFTLGGGIKVKWIVKNPSSTMYYLHVPCEVI